MAARGFVLVWLLPALAINLDWSANGRPDWNIAAALTIAATAVIFEAVRHAKGRAWLVVLLTFGALLFLSNVANGFRNAAIRSGDSSDHRRGEIEAAQRAIDQRARLRNGRFETVAIAGERPASDYQAQIDRLKTGDAKRWNATNGCDANGGITLAESMAFCANLAVLRGKFEAAQTRDQIDNELAALDRRHEGAAPTSADPFADNVAGILNRVGVTAVPESVRVFFDAVWAMIPELIAAFMPALSLLLIDHYQHQCALHEVTTRLTRSRDKVEGAAAPPVDPFARFVAEMLEPAPGERLAPSEGFRLWQSWCGSNGRDPESQRWLGLRLGRLFPVEERHNRKYYLNVRPRHAGRLRLVSAA